ncbi:MAG: Holliday junction branch migration protein RuvA [Rhodothalassiaceae bacterium]
MIARLRGVLDSLGADWAVIDVGGVGYLVFASRRTLGALPRTGEPAALYIETHVREDHIHLYGFASERERDMFRLLTAVSGVGAKVALAILSVLDADALEMAIAAGDKAAVARAQGVGPKLAQRIVSELKDKVAGIAFAPRGASLPERAAGGAPDGGAAEDAVSALVHLGYGRAEAFTAVMRAAGTLAPESPVAELIRAGLKELGK